MAESKKYRPRKPAGLEGAGADLWVKITTKFGMGDHELATLEELCRAKSRIEALDRIAAEEGLMVDSPQGRRVHPAAVESRMLSQAYARLASLLDFPEVK